MEPLEEVVHQDKEIVVVDMVVLMEDLVAAVKTAEDLVAAEVMVVQDNQIVIVVHL